MSNSTTSQMIGIKEVCSLLSVSKTTFYRRIIDHIPVYQIGGKTVIRLSDILEFVERQRASGPRQVGVKRCRLPNRYDPAAKVA